MSEFMMVLLLVGVGTNDAGDLLDFMQTPAYWQLQQDAEKPVITPQSMKAVLSDPDATPTDKLMAVRTLGELGMKQGADKVALRAMIKPYEGSAEPFMAEYAARALAQIDGKVLKPRPQASRDDLDKDLALLSSKSTMVAQFRVGNGPGPIDWATLIPELSPKFKKTRQEMIEQATETLGEALMNIGNARLDAFTFGMDLTAPENVQGMLVARGKYDRIAVQIVMEKLAEEAEESARGDEKIAVYSIGDIEIVSMQGEYEHVAMLMPSDEVFVLLFSGGGFGGGQGKPLPIEETAKRMEKGVQKLGFNELITGQLKQIDRDKAYAWMALELPKFIKEEAPEYIGPFNAARIVATRGDTPKFVHINCVVEGTDADQIALSTERLNKELKEGQQEFKQFVEEAPKWAREALKPTEVMMDSIKLKADGKQMTGSMKMPTGFALMVPMVIEMDSRSREFEKDEDVPPFVEDFEEAEALEAVPAE